MANVQFTIQFNQVKALEHGLDLFDATLFCVVSNLMSVARFRKKTINDIQFTWVQYEAIIEAAPILKCKRQQTLSDAITSLIEKGLLLRWIDRAAGNKTYFAPGDAWDTMFFEGVNSQRHQEPENKRPRNSKRCEVAEQSTPSVDTQSTPSVEPYNPKSKKKISKDLRAHTQKIAEPEHAQEIQEPTEAVGGVEPSAAPAPTEQAPYDPLAQEVLENWQAARDAAYSAIHDAGCTFTENDRVIFFSTRSKRAWDEIYTLECGDVDHIAKVFVHAFKYGLGKVNPAAYGALRRNYDNRPNYRRNHKDGMDGAREFITGEKVDND